MINAKEYYRKAEYLTDISKHEEIINELTDNPEYICKIVQGLMVHGAWCKFYGVEDCPEKNFDKVSMSDLLDKIISLYDKPLMIPRTLEKRIIASCREFATLAVSVKNLTY